MLKTTCAALTLLALGATAAAAGPSSGAFVRQGELVLAPLAFAQFCLTYPQECERGDGAVQFALTPERRKAFDRLNRRVNAAIRPVPDAGRDLWSLDRTEGDCDDYAVQKRKALRDFGVPTGAMALTMVVTPRGEPHLILVVRTDAGDLLFDNFRDAVTSAAASDYRFVKMQSFDDAQAWVTAARPGARDAERVASVRESLAVVPAAREATQSVSRRRTARNVAPRSEGAGASMDRRLLTYRVAAGRLNRTARSGAESD